MKITHRLTEGARPSSGTRLFAHTAAFLALSGMTRGATVPYEQATAVVGPTAVKYHRLLGNFEPTETGLKLTPQGREFFRELRTQPDPELIAAYVDVLSTGNANAKVVKHAGSIAKLA